MKWAETELEVCTNLNDLRAVSLSMMLLHISNGLEIHHVAGAVSADGDEHIARNLAELLRHRQRVAEFLGSRAIVITAPAIFTEKVYSNLKIFELQRDEREHKLKDFWRGVLGSGLINTVHFTPGWERSPGSCDEHEAAQEYQVNISYLPDGLEITK